MTDVESLADMAPALALMRADPLDHDDLGTSFARKFETHPYTWRMLAIHALTNGPLAPRISEPLP